MGQGFDVKGFEAKNISEERLGIGNVQMISAH